MAGFGGWVTSFLGTYACKVTGSLTGDCCSTLGNCEMKGLDEGDIGSGEIGETGDGMAAAVMLWYVTGSARCDVCTIEEATYEDARSPCDCTE
jgi:hypothetical protein